MSKCKNCNYLEWYHSKGNMYNHCKQFIPQEDFLVNIMDVKKENKGWKIACEERDRIIKKLDREIEYLREQLNKIGKKNQREEDKFLSSLKLNSFKEGYEKAIKDYNIFPENKVVVKLK